MHLEETAVKYVGIQLVSIKLSKQKNYQFYVFVSVSRAWTIVRGYPSCWVQRNIQFNLVSYIAIFKVSESVKTVVFCEKDWTVTTCLESTMHLHFDSSDIDFLASCQIHSFKYSFIVFHLVLLLPFFSIPVSQIFP